MLVEKFCNWYVGRMRDGFGPAGRERHSLLSGGYAAVILRKRPRGPARWTHERFCALRDGDFGFLMMDPKEDDVLALPRRGRDETHDVVCHLRVRETHA